LGAARYGKWSGKKKAEFEHVMKVVYAPFVPRGGR
jgi:hypothetical protein